MNNCRRERQEDRMQKVYDNTSWLKDKSAFSHEMREILKAQEKAKKELRQEAKRWSNLSTYKLA